MRTWVIVVGCFLIAGCGERHQATTVVVDRPEFATTGHLTVQTPAVGLNGAMAPEFTAAGARTMPKITWSGVPPQTRELELLIEDPDAPGDIPYVHLLVEGIDPKETEYPGNSGVLAQNSAAEEAYAPPNPPPGAPHHYHFEVLAVGIRLGEKPISRDELLRRMASHVIASGQVVGKFGG